MRKRDMAKAVLGFGAYVGTGMLVGHLARAVVPVDAGKVSTVFMRVGLFAMAGVAGDAAEKHISKQVDEFAEGVDAIKDAFKGAKASVTNITNVTNIDDKKE